MVLAWRNPAKAGTDAAIEAGDEGSEEKGQQGVLQRSQRGREHSRFLPRGFGAAVNGRLCLKGMLAASLGEGRKCGRQSSPVRCQLFM